MLVPAQVQRDFEELPAEAASALRDSLVELLLRFAAGSAPVRTQLCLAVAALAAHMPPQRWAPAGSAVAWLVQRLTKEPGQAALPCLLELLTVLPQVCSWRRHARGVPAHDIRPRSCSGPRACHVWCMRARLPSCGAEHRHDGNLAVAKSGGGQLQALGAPGAAASDGGRAGGRHAGRAAAAGLHPRAASQYLPTFCRPA